MITNKIPARIGSAIVDQISLALASVVFSIPKLVFELFRDSPSSPHESGSIAVYEAIILFTLFLNKDIYFGRSLGKYFTGLRVVSIKTGNPASPIQCSVRNLFLLLWPLEAIILMFSPERRIGDVIAGTRVLESMAIAHEWKNQFVPAIISIIASFVIIFKLFTFIDSLGIM